MDTGVSDIDIQVTTNPKWFFDLKTARTLLEYCETDFDMDTDYDSEFSGTNSYGRHWGKNSTITDMRENENTSIDKLSRRIESLNQLFQQAGTILRYLL